MSATQEHNDRLIALLPQIEARARHYVARYRHDLEPLDVVGEAAVSFLKRASGDPAFLQRDDEAIVTRTVQDGWNAVRSQHRHERYQAPLMEGDGGEELLAGDGRGPEEEAIRADLAERVQGIIANLKLSAGGYRDTYFVVIEGLMEGLSPTQVMASLGVKKQNWPHYRRRLQHAFMALA